MMECADGEYVFYNDIKRLKEALREVQKYNRLSTDLDADAYLVAITNWGLGEILEKPNPEDYGIELEEQQT
jgi:hypothetical protein